MFQSCSFLNDIIAIGVWLHNKPLLNVCVKLFFFKSSGYTTPIMEYFDCILCKYTHYVGDNMAIY